MHHGKGSKSTAASKGKLKSKVTLQWVAIAMKHYAQV